MTSNLTQIHIGREIEKRLVELRLSKSEFGRKIGIPQQNVNRLLEKKSIDTDKLVSISLALDFNFFELYVDKSSVQANQSAVSLGSGDSTNVIGSDVLVERVKYLESSIKDKEAIINDKNERIAELKERIDELKRM